MVNFTHVEGKKKVGDIKIFALSTCGWCRKTKQFLNDHDIDYSYVDVDLEQGKAQEEALTEQEKFNPNGSFPTIVIDDKKTIIGYDEDALKELASA